MPDQYFIVDGRTPVQVPGNQVESYLARFALEPKKRTIWPAERLFVGDQFYVVPKQTDADKMYKGGEDLIPPPRTAFEMKLRSEGKRFLTEEQYLQIQLEDPSRRAKLIEQGMEEARRADARVSPGSARAAMAAASPPPATDPASKLRALLAPKPAEPTTFDRPGVTPPPAPANAAEPPAPGRSSSSTPMRDPNSVIQVAADAGTAVANTGRELVRGTRKFADAATRGINEGTGRMLLPAGMAMDWYLEKIPDKLRGTERGAKSATRQLAEQLIANAELLRNAQAGERPSEKLMGDIVAGGTSMIPLIGGVTAVAPLGAAALPAVLATQATPTGDAKEVVKAAIEGAAMHGIGKVSGGMPRGLQRATAATGFGGLTAAQGGDVQDLAASAVLGGALPVGRQPGSDRAVADLARAIEALPQRQQQNAQRALQSEIARGIIEADLAAQRERAAVLDRGAVPVAEPGTVPRGTTTDAMRNELLQRQQAEPADPMTVVQETGRQGPRGREILQAQRRSAAEELRAAMMADKGGPVTAPSKATERPQEPPTAAPTPTPAPAPSEPVAPPPRFAAPPPEAKTASKGGPNGLQGQRQAQGAVEPPAEKPAVVAQPPAPAAPQAHIEWARSLPDADSGQRKNNVTDEPFKGEFKPGTLSAERYGEDPYIYEDRMIDPKTLLSTLNMEGQSYESVANMPTTQRYAEWYRQGNTPPPIAVVFGQVDQAFKSTNRRRVVAAIEAGVDAIPARVEIGKASEVYAKRAQTTATPPPSPPPAGQPRPSAAPDPTISGVPPTATPSGGDASPTAPTPTKPKRGGFRPMSQEARERNPIAAMVEDNGGIRPYARAADDTRPYLKEHYESVPMRYRARKGGGGRAPDQMLEDAQRAGLLPPDATVEDLTAALRGSKRTMTENEWWSRKQAEAEAVDAKTDVATADTLAVGDTFTIKGENYRVLEETDTALRVKDGIERWLPFDDTDGLRIDKGSLRGSDGKAKEAKAPVEATDEFAPPPEPPAPREAAPAPKAETPATPAPKPPTTVESYLNDTPSGVKLKIPTDGAGNKATHLRVTDAQGRTSDVTIDDVQKGENALAGTGVVKVQAVRKVGKSETVLSGKVEVKPTKLAERATGVLDRMEQEARDEIKRLRGGGTAGMNKPLGIASNYVAIGAIKIAKGAVRFADFSKAMIDEFGESVRPILRDIYAAARKLAGAQYATDDAFRAATTKEGASVARAAASRNLSLISEDPTVRRQFRALDANMEAAGMPEPQTVKQWDAAAKKVYDEKGGELAYNELIGGKLDTVDPVNQRLAKMVMDKEAAADLASGDESRVLRATQAMWNIRKAGTEWARAGVARRDAYERPADRMRSLIRNMLTAPTENDIAAGLLTNDAKMQAGIQRAARRTAKLIEHFKKMGVDITNLSDADLANPKKLSSILREIQTSKSSWADKEMEWWRNSILSGPGTQIVNAMGNTANGFYEYAMLRPTQGILNALTGNRMVDATTLADLGSVYKAIFSGETWQRAWRNAVDAFTTEQPITGGMRIEEKGAAIPGRFGRVVRVPQRFLLAGDELAKSVIVQAEVGASAARLGRKQGLKDADLDTFIRDQISDTGSDAWADTLNTAKRITFQTEAGKVARLALQGRAMQGPLGWVLRHLVPFVTTPSNIIKTGVKRTPLGAPFALRDVVRAAKGTGSVEDASRAVAEQLLAAGAAATVYALVNEKDKDGLPKWITGSSPKSSEERDFMWRTIPPQHIRVPGTDQWVSYQRIEPFATSLSIMADIMEDNGKPIGEKGWNTITGLVRDKTMMQGLSDLMEFFEGGERGLDKLNKWSANFAASYMPNLIRSTLRAADPKVRKVIVGEGNWPFDAPGWQDWARRTGQSALPHPIFMPPAKVDLYGRDVVKDSPTGAPQTDFLYRALIPVNIRKKDKLATLDRWLVNYNAMPQHEADQYFPALPARTDNGKSMSNEQYRDFLRLRGEEIVRLMDAGVGNIDPENPKEQDRKKIEMIFGMATTRAKSRMKTKE